MALSRPRDGHSPWAPARRSAITLSPPAHPIHAELTVPGSKSFANRALILAAQAEGTSQLGGFLRSDDTYWCLDALRRLGVRAEVEGETVTVEGCGGRWPVARGSLFAGSAGTVARFLPGALAAAPGGEWVLDGSDQLRSRPLEPLVQALRTLGGHVEAVEGGGLPLRVWGGGLRGGRVSISGKVSSQFLSGLLLAAPKADASVTVEVEDDLVQPAYVGITLAVMRRFGARVEHDAGFRRIEVHPGPYRAADHVLEADASTASYFLALAAASGGRVRVTNVGAASLQPDARFVDVLEAMGARVIRGDAFLEVAGSGHLRGGLTVDMKPMSDQALTVGVLAALADGPVTVTGVAHIRQHESDRIAVLAANLGALGIRAEEHPDGFTVHPGEPRPGTVDPHDDHRVAMAFALLAARVPGVRILGPGCVSKTYPGFFEKLGRLGVGVQSE
ncbi:3-phosphoshikimate 1-carboxyvinyltransferase [Limnochorda pilosa]|uniref:3-phosphoshikimate 1-carboxyvinyltransferase n=1 Tax=Limnochorda pilosa TaxID=1555112 RepID=A0A0K2SHB1_LIMPI|nr:3-phosphoshikimate 1-carboxyvinyltransferase [Limnochorda pilosa]BAS26194.1 3-phosphoshikimate 1-carboxyvinyltransferase [Limnochorda pilosa]